jgi:Amt family ammonium transporter
LIQIQKRDKIMNKLLKISILASVSLILAMPSFAQDAAIIEETPPMAEIGYILNSFMFLVTGFLVMFMAAGFTMLEAGLVRQKNVTMQLTKNIALFSLAAIMYYAVGYNLMYPGDGWIASNVLGMFAPASLDPVGLTDTDPDLTYASVGSDFFFQLMFCGATCSIVSGALAERIKLWPFLAFCAILTAFIYPIQASWKWGGGFLNEMGFATLGTFILWLGWFGFNGGSQLYMDTASNIADISRIFANTNAGAAGGALGALILTQLLYGRPDLTMVLNGALAGLVSITAEPLTPSLGAATAIGAAGGVLAALAVPLLDKLKIDDVVGAIPVHLVCGIWGTLAVCFTNNDASSGTQLYSILVIGTFTFVASGVVWLILKMVFGIRVSAEDEIIGLDKSELGMEAYPEFTKG